jgi:hypothetical protein
MSVQLAEVPPVADEPPRELVPPVGRAPPTFEVPPLGPVPPGFEVRPPPACPPEDVVPPPLDTPPEGSGSSVPPMLDAPPLGGAPPRELDEPPVAGGSDVEPPRADERPAPELLDEAPPFEEAPPPADEEDTPPLAAVAPLPACAVSGPGLASQAKNAHEAPKMTEVPKSEFAFILVSIHSARRRAPEGPAQSDRKRVLGPRRPRPEAWLERILAPPVKPGFAPPAIFLRHEPSAVFVQRSSISKRPRLRLVPPSGRGPACIRRWYADWSGSRTRYRTRRRCPRRQRRFGAVGSYVSWVLPGQLPTAADAVGIGWRAAGEWRGRRAQL